MAFLIRDTMGVIRDELLKVHYFSRVELGEPKSAPVDAGIVVYFWMESIQVVALTLDKTIEVYTLTVRVHSGLFQEPVADIETDMQEAVSKADEALFANFTLDNKVRHIDVAGIYGTGYRVDWGHADIGGTLYRVADITLPLLVDDSAALAA